MPFGIGSAPLLWGRVAAGLSRFGQAIFKNDDEGRIETYVDDPIIALAGTPSQRIGAATALLVFWNCLGCELAWDKAEFGNTVMWIGVQHTILPFGIEQAIDEARAEKLDQEITQALGAKGLVFNLRSLAGQMSWIAGIAPRVRPFNSHLWASLTEMDKQHVSATSSARKRPKDLLTYVMLIGLNPPMKC